MSSYCHECGEKLGKDDEFCPNCGKSVKEESKKMKINKKHILLISVAIIAIIFSVFGLPYLSNLSKNDKFFNEGNNKISQLGNSTISTNQIYANEINTESSANLINGNSVVINFASSASEISECDKLVVISLDVKNTGKNSIDTDTMSVCLNGKNFPGKTSEQMWAIDSSTQQCQPLKKTIISGDTASFKWITYSPYVPFPLTRADGFRGRISYNYNNKTYFIDSNEIPMNIGGIKGKDASLCLAFSQTILMPATKSSSSAEAAATETTDRMLKTVALSIATCSNTTPANNMINFTIQNIGTKDVLSGELTVYVDGVLNTQTEEISSGLAANAQAQVGVQTSTYSKTRTLKVQGPSNTEQIFLTC